MNGLGWRGFCKLLWKNNIDIVFCGLSQNAFLKHVWALNESMFSSLSVSLCLPSPSWRETWLWAHVWDSAGGDETRASLSRWATLLYSAASQHPLCEEVPAPSGLAQRCSQALFQSVGIETTPMNHNFIYFNVGKALFGERKTSEGHLCIAMHFSENNFSITSLHCLWIVSLFCPGKH